MIRTFLKKFLSILSVIWSYDFRRWLCPRVSTPCFLFLQHLSPQAFSLNDTNEIIFDTMPIMFNYLCSYASLPDIRRLPLCWWILNKQNINLIVPTNMVDYKIGQLSFDSKSLLSLQVDDELDELTVLGLVGLVAPFVKRPCWGTSSSSALDTMFEQGSCR